MNDLVIKTHNFEAAKRGLKKFSEKKAEELEIDSVAEGGGFFNLGNHKVTGAELNSRLEVIQMHMIDLNTNTNRTIKEFGQVYSALEALDKDYIQAILISIKATEKTSQEIKKAQENIKEVVDRQKKTLEVLKKFKQKLDNYDHLEDVDKIWSDCQKWYENTTALSDIVNDVVFKSSANAEKIRDLNEGLKLADQKSDDLLERLNQQIAQVEVILTFTQELEKIVHLKNIDEMWESLSGAHESLEKMCTNLDVVKAEMTKHQLHLDALQEYRTHLGTIKHLDSVDSIWDKTENHSTQLDGLTCRSENTLKLVQANQSNIEKLAEYKAELGSIAHLGDVDHLWDKTENHSTQLDGLNERSEDTLKLVQANQSNIENLAEYKAELGRIAHLGDVDHLWNKTENHSTQLDGLTQQSKATLKLVQVNQSNIQKLAEYKAELGSIVHLGDVDHLWDSNERHSNRLLGLEKESEKTKNLIQANKALMDHAVAGVDEKSDQAVQLLAKKIKHANLLAGGALGIALIELFVILLKVI